MAVNRQAAAAIRQSVVGERLPQMKSALDMRGMNYMNAINPYAFQHAMQARQQMAAAQIQARHMVQAQSALGSVTNGAVSMQTNISQLTQPALPAPPTMQSPPSTPPSPPIIHQKLHQSAPRQPTNHSISAMIADDSSSNKSEEPIKMLQTQPTPTQSNYRS